jgi:PilZ domain
MKLKILNTKPSKEPPKSDVALPERADAVTIIDAHGGRTPARVAENDGECVLVAPISRDAEPTKDGQVERLALEFTIPRGRIRLEGDVELEGRDLLRFADLHPTELLQEREYVRVASARPVTLQAGGTAGTVQTYSVDLSGGGILLAGPSTLKIGERIPFQLTTEPDRPPISGVGIVVRADTASRRAIEFDQISEGDRRRLVRFIFECQRVERRRGLQRSDQSAS